MGMSRVMRCQHHIFLLTIQSRRHAIVRIPETPLLFQRDQQFATCVTRLALRTSGR